MKKLSLIIIIIFSLSFVSYSNAEDIFTYAENIQKEIDSSLDNYAKAEDKEVKKFALVFALLLNDRAFDNIGKWVVDNAKKISNDSSIDDTKELYTLQALNLVRKSLLTSICRNYNRIALCDMEMKLFDEAKSIYRKVIREFDPDDFKNCFVEAEVTLRELANK